VVICSRHYYSTAAAVVEMIGAAHLMPLASVAMTTAAAFTAQQL
jgi:hypothetical protein